MRQLSKSAAEQSWKKWQAEKQASFEADERAIAEGRKTREQLLRENSVAPADAALDPLPWDEILR